MKELNELYKVTVALFTILNKEITNQNREETITEVNRLIDEREKVMVNITPPFSKEEQEVGKEIVTLNKEIEKKLEQIFSQLKSEMKQIQQQKKSNRSYINPYGTPQTLDGMYVDSKK